MSAHVLLTGAGGLVGRAVGARLRASGVACTGIDIARRHPGDHDIVECDVRDVHRLHEIAIDRGITGIIHCGAFSGPMLGADIPGSVVAVNVGGTANLLELARIHALTRFVFCSSVSAVGPTEKPCDENVRLNPTTIYGATKAACEHLITAYGDSYGIETVCLRLAAVWGPGRSTVCALGTMIKDAVAKRETRFERGGDFPTQYLHVDDAAEAIVLAFNAKTLPRRVYNVAGPCAMTLSEVADKVRAALPDARIEIGPGGDPMYDWQEEFLTAAARQDLGFGSRVSMEDRIRAFAEAVSPG
jgi:nucleoside-diphosphate-sugar epimerase